MKILLIGGLSVNPERFLPLIETHKVYMISDSKPSWKCSLQAGGPYIEIEEITIEEIEKVCPDIVWNLISPWDGIETALVIKKRYSKIPFVRQSQGGATPWWHNGLKKLPNYDFNKFRNILKMSDGIMVNCDLYRDCLIDQGCEIKNIPYLITNGMATNVDIIPEFSKIERNEEPHVSCIGRNRFPINSLLNNGIKVYDYSMSASNSNYYVRKKCLGDLAMINNRPINIRNIFKFKQNKWKEFTTYNAGLMHYITERGHDYYKGHDINVPGRVNTYILAGILPVINDIHSGIRQLLDPYNIAIKYSSINDLIDKLKDIDYIYDKRKKTRECRYKFSAQYELKRIELFFQSIIDKK